MQNSDLSIETYVLRSRLNEAYTALHERGESMASIIHFQDLWDLKERALLEHRDSVMVPSGWLYQVEHQAGTVGH